MAGWRLSMRKIREVLRLKFEQGLTNRQIALSCNISRPCVAQYLTKAAAAGICWPLPEVLDDRALERRLYPPARVKPEQYLRNRPDPDMPHIHKELRNKHVTLQLLWQEYKDIHPDGLQYSAFCDRYRRWAQKLSVTLRNEYKAGDKLFIDYAGPTIPIVDAVTGEAKPAHLFVAVLGASNYTTWPRGSVLTCAPSLSWAAFLLVLSRIILNPVLQRPAVTSPTSTRPIKPWRTITGRW
jgi:transposase